MSELEMKVIPKAGQVWVGNRYHDEITITQIKDEERSVYWNSNFECGYMSAKTLKCNYTFKPSNDLEWLALHVTEWPDNKSLDMVRLDEDGEVCFAPDWTSCDFNLGIDVSSVFKPEQGKSATGVHYTRQQWQDKRNELFGVEKMKKVEYVKVECLFWLAAKEHEEFKCFFYLFDGEYHPVNSLTVLASQFTSGNIYRRVERDATWHDYVNDFLGESYETAQICWMVKNDESDFIKMCHLVASMTDKPE